LDKALNAVEIEEAVSNLAAAPFDAKGFPYAFLEAFGNKATTIKRLRTGNSNRSDVDGGVLQYNNIHLATCELGAVKQTLDTLRASPATLKQKARFTLATDGADFQAEDLTTGETVACEYQNFPDHFGFFLPLAGISTVKQIRESSFDIRATSRLNKLYVELLRHNPDWSGADHRPDMNHFMARLIFCFFAEDTNIFNSEDLFTTTVERMTAGDASDTHEVVREIFRAMNTKREDHEAAQIKRWAKDFPYVNGGLFSGDLRVPRFSRIARSYLLHVGNLDWRQINPDIFGSMIQAVADEGERGELGMHYTSVPNILKVLNPLFLDNLRDQLEEAGDNTRKLLNLRKRLAHIRVFDPACGSGNFLVIAYKQMREVEAEINRRRGEADRASEIPLTNFRGIELRHFSAEVARLALIIAEYQCDVLYRGQQLALAEFLPLDSQNWITCGNALRLDWLSICPPTGTGVKLVGDDLFQAPLDQAQIYFDNEGGETYICGNPPYLGFTWQTPEQKSDLEFIFGHRTRSWKSLDYVAGWFMKAADYGNYTNVVSAFVSTNSICQGQLVAILWPLIFGTGHEISFAHTSFKWANLASYNAGVTVVIVGISKHSGKSRLLFSISDDGSTTSKEVDNINAYLAPARNIIVEGRSAALGPQARMFWGNKPTDGGHLLMEQFEKESLLASYPAAGRFVRVFLGSKELIQGQYRYCLWIEDHEREDAEAIPPIAERMSKVADFRASSKAAETRPAAAFPHRFRQIQAVAKRLTIVVPAVSSENRTYFTVGLTDAFTIHSNRNFAVYDAPLWNFSIASSRMHLAWLSAVCARFELRYSYSNTIGWNAFPLVPLTEKNKADLTRCAEDILLAREHYFPATIADMYDPDRMDSEFPLVREAHERNDEVLERIYIGRRFKNDTERLEKLFELYTKMAATSGNAARARKATPA
jgi:hypothetical protein